MTKWKKLFGMAALAAVAIVSGCGSKEETKTPEPTKSPVQTEATAPTTAPVEETEPTAIPTAAPGVDQTTEPTAAPAIDQTTEPTAAPAVDQTSEPEATATPEPTATSTPTPEPTAAPAPQNKLNKNGWIFTGAMTHTYGEQDTFTDGTVTYVQSNDTADYYWGFRHLNEHSLKSQMMNMGMAADPEYEAMMREYLCDGTCGGMGACGSYEGFLYVSSETGKKYALAANNYYLIEFTTLEQLEKDYNACEDYFWGELVALPEIETEKNEWGDVIRYDRWKGWTFNEDVRTNGTHTLTKVGEDAGFHTYMDENGISYMYQAEEGTWLFNVHFK